MSDCYDNFECLFSVVLCKSVCFKKKYTVKCLNRSVCDFINILWLACMYHKLCMHQKQQWYASFHSQLPSLVFLVPLCFVMPRLFSYLLILHFCSSFVSINLGGLGGAGVTFNGR